MRMLAFTLALGCSLCVLLLGATAARAGGFSTIGVLPDHATAVTTTPVAAYTNPAALTGGRGLHLFVDGTLVLRLAEYDRATADTQAPAGAGSANVGRASLTNVLAAPALSAAYARDFYALGLGVFVPFGGSARWGKNERFRGDETYVGAVDSPARWHLIEGLWATGYLTGAVAFALPHGVSVGLSTNLAYTRLELTQAMTASLDDNLDAEGRAHMVLDGFDFSFGLGATWEILPGTAWLGASYQAPPGLWRGVTTEGPLRTNFRTGVSEEKIRLEQDYPDILQLGARVRASQHVEARLSGNYQRFSAVKAQCLSRVKNGPCHVSNSGLARADDGPFANFVRRWHDTWGARASASYFFGPSIDGAPTYEAFATFAYDGTAVPDQTLEPGLLDGHDLSLGLGGSWLLTRRYRLSGSFTQQWMIPRDNRGESRLADLPFPNRLPSANGRYEQWISLVNVNLAIVLGDL